MADGLAWSLAGKALAATVDHIWVLTLRGNRERQQHMRTLLETDLELPQSMITYFEGAAGNEWGRWPGVGMLQRRRSERQGWWLAPMACTNVTGFGVGGRGPPMCLQQRYERCAPPNHGLLPRFCNELCYTLSVLSALDDFLASRHERALLLEDDICASHALLADAGRNVLDWLSGHRNSWDLVKLGDCYRLESGFANPLYPKHKRVTPLEKLQSGTCAVRAWKSRDGNGDGRMPPPSLQQQLASHQPLEPHEREELQRNALLPSVPWGQCTHAMLLSRRMASHVVEQAFPVSDVFDNLLVSHFVAQARGGRSAMAMRAVNLSIFAQISKVSSRSSVHKSLRSQNHGNAVRINGGK